MRPMNQTLTESIQLMKTLSHCDPGCEIKTFDRFKKQADTAIVRRTFVCRMVSLPLPVAKQ